MLRPINLYSLTNISIRVDVYYVNTLYENILTNIIRNKIRQLILSLEHHIF